MENYYNIWKMFWDNITQIKGIISPLAKKSNISTESALLLMKIYEFPQKVNAVEQKLNNELLTVGLIENSAQGFTVTGKGAILAKSFCIALQRHM